MIEDIFKLLIALALAYVLSSIGERPKPTPPPYTDADEQEAHKAMEHYFARIHTQAQLETFRRLIELFKNTYRHTTMGMTDYGALLEMYRTKNEEMFPETINQSEHLVLDSSGVLKYKVENYSLN